MSDYSDDEIEGPRVQPRIQNGPPQTTTSELAAGISRWIEASYSFFYVELASLILMFACIADWFPTVWHKYALSVACVSLLMCLILQTAEFLIPGFIDLVVVDKREDGSGGHTVQKVCSVFLLVWWIFGTGIITFHGELRLKMSTVGDGVFSSKHTIVSIKYSSLTTYTIFMRLLIRTIGPFVVTSNGWFGAWGGLLATMKWSIGLENSFFNDQSDGQKQLYNIAMCSVVLLLASIPPITQKWPNYSGAGLSIAGAAFTIVTCAYLLTFGYSEVPRNMMKITVILLFILWAVVAGVTTFHGPFLITNNGFISAWLGCLSALNLMLTEMKDASPERS